MSSARKFTNALVQLVDEGYSDSNSVLRDLMMWMEEKEVKDFVENMDEGIYLDDIVANGILDANYED